MSIGPRLAGQLKQSIPACRGLGALMSEFSQHNPEGIVTVHLFGTFRLLGAEGEDLTPPSAKAQALLAMVATAPNMRRSRSWLQSHLWEGRAPAQAAGSLRQALLEIRRALGQHAALLLADRASVAFRPGSLRHADPPFSGSAEADFLQGMASPDPAFRRWLSATRRQLAASVATSPPPAREPPKSPPRPRPIIVIDSSGGQGPEAAAIHHGLVEFFMRSISESLQIDVFRLSPALHRQIATQPGATLVQIQLLPQPDGEIGLRANVEDLATLHIYWTEFFRLPLPPGQALEENLAFLACVYRIVSAIRDVIEDRQSREGWSAASQLAAIAVRKIFRMSHDELTEAQHLLDQAIAIEPNGRFRAWRAQLAAIRYIERHSADFESLRAQSEEDVAKALERESLNSSALASSSNATLVFTNDPDSSFVLAERSVRANRSNPLAWWSMANACLYGNDRQSAYGAAVAAQTLGDFSHLKPWTDFQRSLAAAVNGRHDEAIAFGKSAHALAPRFRPPLRYLVALFARAGQIDASLKAARKLDRLEEGFKALRLVNDPTYPASMIRRAGLVDADALRPVDEGLEASHLAMMP